LARRRWKCRIILDDTSIGQRCRKRALRQGVAGMGYHNGRSERHHQAADDQGYFSGKVQWFPNVFPIEERLPTRLLRFLPVLNNPWNLSTARRRAAPGHRLLR
jgi:hypothetical protein